MSLPIMPIVMPGIICYYRLTHKCCGINHKKELTESVVGITVEKKKFFRIGHACSYINPEGVLIVEATYIQTDRCELVVRVFENKEPCSNHPVSCQQPQGTK